MRSAAAGSSGPCQAQTAQSLGTKARPNAGRDAALDNDLTILDLVLDGKVTATAVHRQGRRPASGGSQQHRSESANGMGMQVPPPVTSIYTPNGQLLATEVAGRLRVGEGASGCAGHSVVRTTTPLVRHIHFVANAGVSPSY